MIPFLQNYRKGKTNMEGKNRTMIDFDGGGVSRD